MSRTSLPEFDDDVIILRQLQVSDARQHLDGEDDEQVRWLSGGIGSMETVIPWIERNLESWRTGGPVRNFGIWEFDSGALLGNIEANLGASIAGVGEGDANISYGLFPMARGRGIATRAVRMLCAYLAGIGVEYAVIRVEMANEPSVGVAVRAGFVRAGEVTTNSGEALTCFRKQLQALSSETSID